jgi:hypothetical protein
MSAFSNVSSMASTGSRISNTNGGTNIEDVDIRVRHSQDGEVNRQARVVLVLLTVALLPWLGLLQAVPHHHADATVSQEALACSASSPSSSEIHLHTAGHLLPFHPCLACLAAASHAAVPSLLKLVRGDSTAQLPAERPHEVRSRSHAHLPLLRGPPVVA